MVCLSDGPFFSLEEAGTVTQVKKQITFLSLETIGDGNYPV